MSQNEWDERYASRGEGLWSGEANGVLVGEVAGMRPSRALDVGAGEGADAIWLARAGWDVTAIEISPVAVERAEAAARNAGVDVEWLCADVSAIGSMPCGYDLVSVQYPALKHSPGDEAIQFLLDAVAPGGTLLLVGHAPLDAEYARAHGFEISDYVQPSDVEARLDEGWRVEVHEARPRVDPIPDGSPFTHDAVLRASRRP